MLVTDKQYSMEVKMKNVLDLMIKRISGSDDVILPIDGDEGQGKTEMAFGICYYVAHKTGREYNMNNVFFDLKKLIDFVQKTKNQVIHFDEAALGLLINQRWDKAQEQFIQLVMVARKKRHFIVLCIPKFHRLPTYVIEDRVLGLVHVYSRRNIEKGRFCYFKRDAKDKLYEYWKTKKVKAYKKFYTFHGTFPEASKKIFTQKDMDEYENKKDLAILSIGQKKDPKKDKFQIQRNKIICGFKKDNNLTSQKMREQLLKWGVDISSTMIRDMVRLNEI